MARAAEAIRSLIQSDLCSKIEQISNRAAHPTGSGLPRLREGYHHEALSHVAGAAASWPQTQLSQTLGLIHKKAKL